MSINLKTLISKLNDTCRRATERAANLCMAQGHYEVDLEHLFLALLEEPQNDIAVIARYSRVSLEPLEQDLNRELKSFRTGNSRTPVFSSRLPVLFKQAWLIASLDRQTTRIRSGHLLLALLTLDDLAQIARRVSPVFDNFNLPELKHNFAKATEGSAEASEGVALVDDQEAASSEADAPAKGLSKTPALDQFTTNLTERAREGKIDPVIGRDQEIRQLIDILMRRRQNNPILTGEAGVGKTAVVEGLARKIVADDVPPPLLGVALHTLDMGLLQAGASVKGEFENRLKNVIEEVKKSSVPIILFIDEAHTIIGAGGQAGQGDAANLLKPALARGELRTIAATTWGEYKKYFEKDAALARRFQVIKVEEPSEELAAAMLRGMVPLMEAHFNVRILDEAITAACRLSHRYVAGRQLPDKGVSVLDTACARVALAQTSTPAVIDDANKQLERLAAEIGALKREEKAGSNHQARLQALEAEQQEISVQLSAHQAQWEQEQEFVNRIKSLRQAIDNDDKTDEEKGGDDPRKALQAALEELSVLQGETALIPIQVDANVIAEIIASWTGIPLGKMVKDEINTVRQLKPTLAERVIGQDHALEAVAQRVRTARANLEDPNKPKGVFLFVGPSGVGKTETALALADALYGGERKLITINMSEYQEAHTVSSLKGAPPGYVGYGEGGVLTEAVRRSPYSVVLLDEVEKAHPDVLEVFFQVFDKGVMEDGEGREIDFRNTLIILTSNVGSSQVMQACLNKAPEELPTPDELHQLLMPALHQTFKAAFLGRLAPVPFYPISDDVLEQIIRLKLDRIGQRIAANHQASFSYSNALVEAVLARCIEVDSGARNVDNILNGTLLPEVADTVLARMAEGEPIAQIKVGATKKGAFTYNIK